MSKKKIESKKDQKRKKRRHKGFTMVELLVALTILGLLLIMAFPTMRSIKTGSTNNKLDQYGKTIISATKQYVDSYEDDLFSKNIENDVADVTFNQLKSKDLIKDIGLDDIDCSATTVTVVKFNDDYTYCLNMKCSKGGTNVYTKVDKGDNCTAVPKARIKYIYKSNKKEIEVSKSSSDYKVESPKDLALTFDEKADRFIYWNASNGKTYKAGEKINEPINNQIVLTAQFKSDAKVKIKVNVNNGQLIDPHDSTISQVDNFITVGGSVFVHQIYIGDLLTTDGLIDWNNKKWVNLARTGYHIEEDSAWNTKPDGTGKTYSQRVQYSSSDFCADDCEVILYANWVKDKPKYTLTYDSDGGTNCNPASVTKEEGQAWGTLCTPSKTDHTFGGWFTAKNGVGEQIKNTSTANGNKTVYAKWTKNTTYYTLSYNDNGGSGCSSKSITKEKNQKWGTLCTPTRKYYTFGGWKSGSTTINSNSTAQSSITVVAQWKYNATATGVYTVCSRDGVQNWWAGGTKGTCTGSFNFGDTKEPQGHWEVTVREHSVKFYGTNIVQADKHKYCFEVKTSKNGTTLATGCQTVRRGHRSNKTLTW